MKFSPFAYTFILIIINIYEGNCKKEGYITSIFFGTIIQSIECSEYEYLEIQISGDNSLDI